tara:strand:- start:2913 stop:3101 length:189 start_codon:yes stop_codon:yes gene_type:complete
MKEGPLLNTIMDDEKNDRDLIQQIFITYYKDDEGRVKKETITRQFLNDDYTDSTRIEVLSLK